MPTSPTSPFSPPTSRPSLDRRSKDLRTLVLRAFGAGRRGHLGSAFSLVEMLRVLYDDVLRFDATKPLWEGRDRMILSKGHGCLALYAILADKSFFPESELMKFCHIDGKLGGHPERGKVPGVEASTGSLGHGLSIGVGMALALRARPEAGRVFVIDSDGECNEGSLWEAALSASKHRLENLTVLVDYNHMQSYSTTAEVLNLEPMADKWRAFGFAVKEVDGHDVASLREALKATPFEPGRPSALICHTVKGRGVPLLEWNAAWHHKNKVTDEEVATLLAALEEA
ncbi:transketolase [Geothrix limicola]|uniref:Transketolase n=1 Tax=Geothrix limicola TaxID=2927978 RepID=A0ABQ5QEU7_9BACT|nr:transketolase [Geothrix limicola]GLH73172.1 transketolase [Geothrix limicola]